MKIAHLLHPTAKNININIVECKFRSVGDSIISGITYKYKHSGM